MISLNGVCPGSLLASVSGLICFAQLEVPSLEGLHDIVHVHVNCISGFSDRNFLCGLQWCRGLFARDCRKVHHYWHLWELNSSWDWMRGDTKRHTCSFRMQEGERIGSLRVIEEMLSEWVAYECGGVSAFYFEFHYCFRSQICWECFEQHFHRWVLGQCSLVDHVAVDVVIGKDKDFQADVPMFYVRGSPLTVIDDTWVTVACITNARCTSWVSNMLLSRGSYWLQEDFRSLGQQESCNYQALLGCQASAVLVVSILFHL